MTHSNQSVQRVLIITLILNLAAAMSKMVIGLLSGSLAILADGFHSLSDGLGNVAALIANRIASQPPDDDHPYGHHRFETVGALAIGILLLLTGWEVLQGGIERLLQGGEIPTVSPLMFAVLIATLIMNIFVSTYQKRMGHKLQSELLLADAENTQADVFVTLSVLMSTALVAQGWVMADTLVALGVAALIIRAALGVLWQAGGILVDTAPYDPHTLQDCAACVNGVSAVSRARSRGTHEAAHIDIDVLVSPQLTTAQTAAIANDIRAEVRAHIQSHGGDVAEIEVHFAPNAPEYLHAMS